MKKYNYVTLTVAVVVAFVPFLSRAQTATGDVPPPPLQSVPPSIRDRIRTNIQTHVENAQNNQDYRNMMLEQRIGSSTIPLPPQPEFGSTTPGMRGMPPIPFNASNTDGIRGWRYGSTTPIFPGMPENVRERILMFASSSPVASTTILERLHDAGYENDGRGMMFDMFRMRKDNAARQLETALANLERIRTRIGERIQTEQQNGADMTNALALLATADTQLSAASTSISALEAYVPAATSTITASTTIDLGTARQLVTAAQTAVKTAQKSLTDVVIAIAHAMGLKIGQDGNDSSATSTATSTTSQ